jgi:phosphate transport system substrate-binding protein
VTGVGATFPYPVYTAWAGDYLVLTGEQINYQGLGSGAGIKQMIAKSPTAIFGATDKPLKTELLDKHGLIQFPAVLGGVVPVVNLDGIAPGELRLDGPTLAKIFLGEIKWWNDERIQKLNPHLKLSKIAIRPAPIHRSDGSGETFLFTDYLSKVSAEWKKDVGSGTFVQWPKDGMAGKGNNGVGIFVQQIKGAIGYIGYPVARLAGMTYTSMINKRGEVVSPGPESFQAALAGVDWSKFPDFDVSLTNTGNPGSWDITAVTFILIPKKPADPAATTGALRFFSYALTQGMERALKLHYASVPASVVPLVEVKWQQITGADGKPLLFTPSLPVGRQPVFSEERRP